MTTKNYLNGAGDWTIKTIFYPDGWRALVILSMPSNYTNQYCKLESTLEFLVDGFDDEEDAIDAAKYEADQFFLNN
jgi:hypothetical protein